MKQQSVLFESWRGRYADSPKAISERLRTMRPELRQLWVAGDSTELPAGVVRLRRHSREYFTQLFACDYLVTNDIVSKHLIKGPKVTYLQTWHGTSIKHLGFDETVLNYPGAAAHRRRMVRDVRKWDFLLSPSPASSHNFRSAFRYSGQILEAGYPRNDVLKSPNAEQIRTSVRAKLGIEPDQQVVLYAPTWRDNVQGPDGRFRDPGAVDFELLFRLTKPGTVVLNRMHNVVVADSGACTDPRRIDVSRYPDISDLFLAADVLVSDYSSAIYDFAVTGKPILLYAYDLDRYINGLGLYFDYEAWAPGPIVQDTESLAAALVDLDAQQQVRLPRYRDFVARFCPYEDGQSSRRVIERVFQ